MSAPGNINQSRFIIHFWSTRVALSLAILGAAKTRILKELRSKPSHGYALAKQVGVPVGVIYRHLAELRADELVDHRPVERRKEYFLTDKGKRLLKVVEE